MTDAMSPQSEVNETSAVSEHDSGTAAVPAKKTGTLKIGGLNRKSQKLQAALEKAAHVKAGGKPVAGASASSFKAKNSFAGKKTNFQRKAV